METIKLWENFSSQYQNFNSIEDYFKWLDENNETIDFIIKDEYSPNNAPHTYLEQIANKNNKNVVYTNIFYPIMAGKTQFNESYVNSEFFKQHKEEFQKYCYDKVIKDLDENFIIFIHDFVMSDELLDKILSSENAKKIVFKYIINTDKELTEEQISKIKNANLEFVIYNENKKISSRKKINGYTIEQLELLKLISIDIPNTNDIDDFKYINDGTLIVFLNKCKDEQEYISYVKQILQELSKHDKKYSIRIDIDNRELLRKSDIINNIGSNISLNIKNNNDTYNMEEYKKNEEILEIMAAPIRDSNLSPLEKYIAVYNIVKQYKKYNENYDNEEESRNLKYILDNDYMVCVGFSTLLHEMLNRVGIENSRVSVTVDKSYRDGFTLEEKPIDFVGHGRNIVRLNDEKYNVNGIYLADATWDNNLEKDFYFNCLMTFDRKKEAKNLEHFSRNDLLLDFHNFDEFNEKINFLLKRDGEVLANLEGTDLRFDYKAIYKEILGILKNIDLEKYNCFYNKYNEKIGNSKLSFNEFEQVVKEFLTEYGEYIIPLSNKEVDFDKIIEAASVVKKELAYYNDEEIENWKEEVLKSKEELETIKFPYKYEYGSNAYLEDRPSNIKR